MEELLHPEWSSEKIEQLKGHYEAILSLLGEDVKREGLLKTPERVAKAMLTLTRGYEQDPHAILLGAKFQEEYRQMVIVIKTRSRLFFEFFRARAHSVHRANNSHDLVYTKSVKVRTEVFCAVVFDLARNLYGGIVAPCVNLDVRIRLVVFEQNVIVGLVLFY